ncbi:MAG: acyl-CoA dehydratase activase [Candidatus Methylomirabilis sp.]|nr:acyl-CoA dehydratase activase [Deltaproteobacteria bacterium]
MSGSKSVYVGIDIGSVSANTVVLDENRNILEEHYTRTKGEPLETALAILAELIEKYGKSHIRLVATTGSGGKLIAPLIGAGFTNEVIAQARATEAFHPEARTVIEMGGQDAKLIFLAPEGEDGKLRIADFQMNSVCAAGTGSFLDQQAYRLGLTIEEFGSLALKSKNPPRVAGRCSVFAKSDMIHLQQIATPDYDIVAGLCYAVARNFKATIGKGKEFVTPVAFQGGVAANLGVRKAFKDVLELDDKDYIIPAHFCSMGALGAVYTCLDMGKALDGFKGVEELKSFLSSGRTRERSLEKLTKPEGHPSERRSATGYPLEKGKKVAAYLGIDVGSTSTNVILIDRDLKLVTKRYLATAGRPLDAIKKGITSVAEECAEYVDVVGVGTTGSGRYLSGDFLGADIIRNEITAQATAAAAIDPEVDTIFEIGGQDSKYIAMKDGVVVDFEMNKVCAAGTGSFLEEQAERLGISIKGEFSELALGCGAPPPMGERCTVFIESDMVHYQQRGVEKDGLVAGLSYSIVLNYLNRVVGDRRIGNRIFFQGGTAANLGVVAAFEKVTGKKITVPEHHDVTGAIGAAILASKEMAPGARTKFKGWDLSKKKFGIESFECRDCSNICEVRKVVMEGEAPLYYGGRCEKYDVKRDTKSNSHIPDLFKEREKLLYSAYAGKASGKDAPVIGIPRMLFMYEMYPFWKAFFDVLGFRIQLSSPTNREIIRNGIEQIVTETCFPIKVAHGHVNELMEKGVKRIFIPSIINLKPAKEGQLFTALCPYVQTIPYLCKSAYDFKDKGVEVLAPVFHFNAKDSDIKKEFAEFGKSLGKDRATVEKALQAAWAAQGEFKRRLLERGKEAIAALKPDDTALVIVGRAYNTMDSGINLELPQKLREMGTMAIPFDMLDVDSITDGALAEDMYWRSGQRILAGAQLIKDDPRLFSIYITNFGCGPDSMISHFYKEASAGKPFLQLEIDEHSADAGAITRCEAFLDSIRNTRGKLKIESKEKHVLKRTNIKKKIYLPNMSDGAHALAAAFEACGLEAEVMPEPDEESLKWGRRYTSGRECYPCILTTGDMVKIVRKEDFSPERSAFFMPSGNGPCRFGQYNRYHRMILDELGFKDVPVYAPDQDGNFYKELNMVGGNFPRLGWWGIASVDLLEKVLFETRPYEKNKGESERVYWECVRKVCDAIREKRFPERELKEAKAAFKRVPVHEPGSKPVIGIVGEIYVRSNRFSNENLIKKLEALGAEVRMPTIGEWIYYTNFCNKRKTWQRGQMGDYLRTIASEFFQKRDEKRMENILNGDLRSGHEVPTKNLLRNAAPYLDDSFEGEAVLSIGKTIDYIGRGAHGIVNAMPFTCMPGTVVNAILKRLRENNDNIPYLHMVYEGSEDTNSMTRMEAFVHQAREFKERRSPRAQAAGRV